MFKILDKPTERLKGKEAHQKFNGLAFILIEPKVEIIDGIEYSPSGRVYAVSDEDDFNELIKESYILDSKGIEHILDDVNIMDKSYI